MRTSTLLSVAFACAAIAFSCRAVLAEDPTPEPAKEYFPQPSERESQLYATLAQHVSIDFHEQPLADVASWFSSKLEVPVILDNRSLEDAGVGSDSPVTRKVDGISARAALELVLDDMDLTYLERDGAILITTQDRAESELFTRVYPVGDLTPMAPVKQRQPKMQGHTSPKNVGVFSVSEQTPAAQPSPSDAQNPEPKESNRFAPDFDSLKQVVIRTVKPQTWDEVGGPGSIEQLEVAKSVVVSQTREVHDEILELLRALRAAKAAGEGGDSK